MSERSQVIETKYVMTTGMDYTEARVRVNGEDLWIRVGGFKASPDAYPFLIQEAELQAKAALKVNGDKHG